MRMVSGNVSIASRIARLLSRATASTSELVNFSISRVLLGARHS